MEEGGAFYLNDILDFNANKLEIYNTTSMHIVFIIINVT